MSVSDETAATAPYPWQARVWRRLMAGLGADRMAHAYLLEGPAGTGKTDLAEAFARAVLCGRPAEEGGCGECRSCELIAADSHPDFLRVAPEEGRDQILIDQVRELSAALGLSSQRAGWKVALLRPADSLNMNAANALLKTLEEPAPDTVLLLVADEPQRLPATVRSRCQRVTFPPPDRETARRWLADQGRSDAAAALAFAGNAPLLALELGEQDFAELDRRLAAQVAGLVAGREDPVALAAEWSGMDTALVLRWLTVRTQELIRRRAGGAGEAAPGSLESALGGELASLDGDDLFSYLDLLYRSAPLLRGQVNRQQLTETLLVPWAHRLRWPTAELARELVSGTRQ